MDELIAMKKKLDEVKEKKARVEGQLQEVMTRITERGYENLDNAESDLLQKEEEARTLKQKMNEKITELKGQYEW